MTSHEPTFSIRMLWPFARLIGTDPRGPALLRTLGLSAHDLVLDQRIPCRVAFLLLGQAVELFRDPALGLRAGATTDQGTFGVLERAASTAPDLRGALDVMTRHLRVMNEAAEVRLVIDGLLAYVHYAPLVPHPVAANDLAVATLLAFIRRHCSDPITPREVWLMHSAPSHVDAYRNALSAPVRFNMPTNTVVLDAHALSIRMRSASPELTAAFERQAMAASRVLGQPDNLARRVRERLAAQLTDGAIDMGSIARALSQSTPTLRRRLQDEGASFSDILEDVRKETAQRHLLAGEITVTEIARLLGFSHVRAFTRAFQRWTGKSPSEFRQRKLVISEPALASKSPVS